MSAGLAVSATVGITGYLEIDSWLHPTEVIATVPAVAPTTAPSTTGVSVPPAPHVTVRTIPDGPVPTAAPPTAPPVTAAPATAPPTTVVRRAPQTTQPYVAPVYVPPTHARTRGSNG